MNKINKYITLFTILATIFLTPSCSKEEETSHLLTEKKNFESYLKKSDMIYTVKKDIYKTMFDSIPADRSFATKGDSIFFNYGIFSFSTTIGTLFDTNDKDLSDLHKANSTFFNFDVKEVELGTTPMVLGLQMGLDSTKKGDTFALLVPSSLAYGKNWNGYIPPFTALYIWVSIKNIKKND